MKYFITMPFLLIVLFSAGQKTTVKTPYDDFVKRFNAKMDTVAWLCEYDNIAWWTSDSVYATSKEEQAKLGAEWFCLKSQEKWHAFYGKYQFNSFNCVYHYTVDSNNVITRVPDSLDSLTLNSYSRAIVNANLLHNKFLDSQKVRFNQYIKQNTDKTFSVWLLPAFTTNSIAVYGGEFYYLFDSTGNNLIKKEEYSQGYKGFKPDQKKEIWLDYSGLEEPTLGGIFFVWYYKTYFEKIVIDTKKFKSIAFRDHNTYYWVHAAKDK